LFLTFELSILSMVLSKGEINLG